MIIDLISVLHDIEEEAVVMAVMNGLHLLIMPEKKEDIHDRGHDLIPLVSIIIIDVFGRGSLFPIIVTML
jgi:hypothetical protein